MRHHYTSKPNDHWAVSWTGEPLPGKPAMVLIQVQEQGNQARIPLTAEEAEYMANELMCFALKARNAKPLELP